MIKDDGKNLIVSKPKCINCKYSQNGFCNFYKKNKLDVKDIFDCKAYKNIKED